jgi:hypothetical protein
VSGSDGTWYDTIDPTTYVFGLAAAGTTSYFIAADSAGEFWWYDWTDVNNYGDPEYVWTEVAAISTTTPQCLTYVSSSANTHYYLQGFVNGQSYSFSATGRGTAKTILQPFTAHTSPVVKMLHIIGTSTTVAVSVDMIGVIYVSNYATGALICTRTLA